MSKSSLVKQTFMLMVASLIARFLGLIYQTILSRTVGPQGLGLYQMTFTVFLIALTLSTAGLSQGVSKLTSEFLAVGDYNNARKNLRISLILVLFSSSIICIFLIFFAPQLANYIFNDHRLILPFRLLTIAIISVSISGVFQGYFQGNKFMLPTAISQVSEQVLRILFIPLIIIPLLNRGIGAATSGIIVSMGLAEITGLIILMIFFLKRKREKYSYKKTMPSRILLKKLIFLAIPIGFGSLISTINYSLSTILIPRAMMLGGATKEYAVESLGYYSGMALPLVFFPTVFTFPIALSLIPGVSEALTTSNLNLLRNRVTLATKFTIVLGFFVALIFKLYSGQLPYLIFGYQKVQYIIAVLAYSTVFCYPQQIFTSILQGLGKPGLALRNLIILTVANLILLLFSVSRYGIIGAAYTFVVVNLLAFIIDFATIRSVVFIPFNIIDWFIKPFLAIYTSYKISILFLNVSSFDPLISIMNIIITTFIFTITLILSTTFHYNELKTILKGIKR
ncbi:putative polysaccharide biosynthesis protein [Anaerobranca gottschalkii]|nr:polysaccharide biosynthesis protein [Anaerobranca gottschalkii]